VPGLRPGHYSNLTAPNLQHTANQERNDQCDNQHHIRELLMMGIVMPETYRAYKKYNKTISGIYFFFYSTDYVIIGSRTGITHYSDKAAVWTTEEKVRSPENGNEIFFSLKRRDRLRSPPSHRVCSYRGWGVFLGG